MLKVTLHHATPARVSAQNILGRLDSGYARLDATADYKAVMQTSGLGEQSPITLSDYPRWSASIWDLVARIVCLGINRREAIWPTEIPQQRRCAFIDDMTAWTGPRVCNLAEGHASSGRLAARSCPKDDLNRPGEHL